MIFNLDLDQDILLNLALVDILEKIHLALDDKTLGNRSISRPI